MEAGQAYLEQVLSQGHDKEFKFSQDNCSDGEQGIAKEGALRSLSGPWKGNVIKKERKKETLRKVGRVQKERIFFPTSLFLTLSL